MIAIFLVGIAIGCVLGFYGSMLAGLLNDQLWFDIWERQNNMIQRLIEERERKDPADWWKQN